MCIARVLLLWCHWPEKEVGTLLTQWPPVVSWVKKVGGAGSCSFLTDSCKFPTEEIMGAQNFYFAPKFTQNRGFSAPKFAFWTNFRTRRHVSYSPKIRGGGANATMPLIACFALCCRTLTCKENAIKLLYYVIYVVIYLVRPYQEETPDPA